VAGIGFIVLAHRRPEQVRRLLARIDGLAEVVYLHVDAPDPGAFVAGSHTALIPSRRAQWGEFGTVDATLDGLCRFVESGGTASHVVLLSGGDYVIKPDWYIERFFAGQPGRSFMEWKPLPTDDLLDRGLSRINRYHLRVRGRKRIIPPLTFAPERSFRPYLRGLHPHVGATWWALSRACAEYVVAYHRDHPRVARFYRRTFMPDEAFFQTVLLNSPRAAAVGDGGVHFVDWSAGGPHPATLTSADIPRLLDSPKLFARKFDVDVDEAALDELDRRTSMIQPPSLDIDAALFGEPVVARSDAPL
jgi:core-2/I-Branching enzyme